MTPPRTAKQAAETGEAGNGQREVVAPPPPISPKAVSGIHELGLHDRIALIQAELVNVPKKGHAEVKMREGGSYSYDYVKEPDMMAAVKPLLGKYRVASYISIDGVEADGNMRVVQGSMTLACSHRTAEGFDEEAYTVRASASGTDKGEKAIIKATTTVTRYLLQKAFLIETDGLDPERENIDHEPGQRSAAGGSRSAPPARAGQGQGKTLTPAQRRKLMAVIKDLEIDLATARRVIAVTAGVLSTKDIPAGMLGTVENDLRGYAMNPGAGDAVIAKWRAENPDLAAALDGKIAAEASRAEPELPPDPVPPSEGDHEPTPFDPDEDGNAEDGGEYGG